MDEILRERAGQLAAKSLKHNPDLILETYLFTAAEMEMRGAPAVPIEIRIIRQISMEDLRDDILTGVRLYEIGAPV